MEKQYYTLWVCIYSLSYPACKGDPPNCIFIGCLFGSTIFFQIILKWRDFRDIYLTQNVCPIFPKCLSKIFFTLKIIQRNIVIHVNCSSDKVHVILVRCYRKLIFLDKFSKNIQVSNVIKIRHWDMDRQTNDDINSRFKHFFNASKMGWSCIYESPRQSHTCLPTYIHTYIHTYVRTFYTKDVSGRDLYEYKKLKPYEPTLSCCHVSVFVWTVISLTVALFKLITPFCWV